jgi:hypothetical protein
VNLVWADVLPVAAVAVVTTATLEATATVILPHTISIT